MTTAFYNAHYFFFSWFTIHSQVLMFSVELNVNCVFSMTCWLGFPKNLFRNWKYNFFFLVFCSKAWHFSNDILSWGIYQCQCAHYWHGKFVKLHSISVEVSQRLNWSDWQYFECLSDDLSLVTDLMEFLEIFCSFVAVCGFENEANDFEYVWRNVTSSYDDLRLSWLIRSICMNLDL